MPMMIERVLRQRMEHLRSSSPWITAESYISHSIEGDWGLIVTIDRDSNVKQYWFFESGCSFRRQEAVDQYNTYAAAGFGVTAACPESCLSALMNRVRSESKVEVQVVSLRSLGIHVSTAPPRPLPDAENDRPTHCRT